MATTRSPEAREATAQRRARVIEMRRQHRTYAEIGAEFGVSAQRAHEIYLDALKSIVAEQVELHRAEASQLAYIAIDDLLLIAREHKAPRVSVEAWGQIRGWAERLARTLNTDTPIKVEATVTETTQEDLAIIELINTAKAKAAAAAAELKAQADE